MKLVPHPGCCVSRNTMSSPVVDSFLNKNLTSTLTLTFLPDIAAGGSDDWVKGVAGVKYAYTVELRDTGRHGFILPASHIEPSGREMLRAVSVLALNVLRERRLQERQQISSSLARRVSS